MICVTLLPVNGMPMFGSAAMGPAGPCSALPPPEHDVVAYWAGVRSGNETGVVRAIESALDRGAAEPTVVVRLPVADYEALLPRLALIRRRLEALVALRTGVHGLRVLVEPGSALARRPVVLRLPLGHADAFRTRSDLGDALDVEGGPRSGLRIAGRPDLVAVGPAGLLLGRAARPPGRVTDPRVSVWHCRVEPAPQGLLVTDLSSTNGTWIDGRRIALPTVLTHRRVARIGSVSFRAEVPA